MTKVNPTYNFGDEVKNINSTLYNQLNETYSNTARVVNTKPTRNINKADPPSDDVANQSYDIGDFWINQMTNKAWILTSRTSNTAVVWSLIT